MVRRRAAQGDRSHERRPVIALKPLHVERGDERAQRVVARVHRGEHGLAEVVQLAQRRQAVGAAHRREALGRHRGHARRVRGRGHAHAHGRVRVVVGL